MRIISAASVAILATVLLAGCSSEPTVPEPEDSTPPIVSQTAPPPSEEPSTQVAPECENLELTDGGTVSGEEFGACVIGFTVAAQTGRQRVTSDTLVGTGDFVFSPSPQAHVVSETPDAEIIVTDSATWVRGDEGWQSGEHIDMIFGEAWRALAQPEVAFGMLAGSDYTVSGPERIEDAHGTEVEAWRFTANDPIGMAGVSIDSLQMWLGNDLAPIRQESTSSYQGMSATTINEYYDWGAAITIEPPEAE